MLAMASWKIGLIVVGAAVLAHFVVSMLPNLVSRRQRGGNSEKGLAIFVEGIRWLGIPWDEKPARNGLRRAGFGGQFIYWKWHATWQAWLVLPVMWGRSMMDREARKLAEHIAEHRRQYPDRPIYLLGCSCGTHVTLRALEMLDEGIKVDAAVLLCGAFDPGRDLSQALRHVEGKMVITSSFADCLILGLGTTLVGTADGRHGPSAGMVGWHGPAASTNTPSPDKVVQIRWRPRMIADGHLGGHFTSETFLAKRVAPLLLQ